MKKMVMILLLSVMLGEAGCMVSEIRTQNRATEAENRQVYEIYRAYMRSSNEERVMSGLPPRPLKSFEEWQKSPGTD